MTFLYPSFLWALAALSIPVLIHLFNFRKTTRIFFSNNRLLKQVKEVTTAKRRLKHYLILASRLLFLFFLIMAFAQPVIPAKDQLDAEKNIVIYLDNSQSMSAQMPDKTPALDAALNFSRGIVDLFPPDTRYRILTNDFAPFSNTFKTKTEALDILAQVRTSSVSRSMEEIQNRLGQHESNRSREFFWISDFQKSTTGVIPTEWDSAARWHLVPITFASAPNVFVDSAYLQNPFAAGGEKNVLTVIVRNDGQEEVNQLNLKLTINDVQAGTVTVDIPPGGLAETSFDLTTGLSGLNRAMVSFNDFPVSFDNEFFLALNFTNKISIIEIKPGSEVTAVERVFGNKQIFNFHSYSVANFNYSLLDQADLVVVNGIDRNDAALNLSLRSYINESGTLLLIPGTKPDVQSMQQLTDNPLVTVVQGTPTLQELDRPDYNNPFFENVFEERSVSMAMPRAGQVLRWGRDRSAILRLKNDEPFLSRLDLGGKLYVLASPLNQSFTDFHNHALFVPVMYRIAGSSRKNDARLYYTLKENFITLKVDSLLQDEPLRLKGAQEIVPAQRNVNDQVFLEIPKFSMTQGFYQVLAGADSVSLIAFNLDKAESLLDQFSGNEMKNQMGNAPNISIFEATSAEAFSNEIKERYLGKALWKYALMIALFFLLVEVLLIRFLK
ncbi:MAG: BatA domain-containing protein [Cyclobacteriaceae bacterium]